MLKRLDSTLSFVCGFCVCALLYSNKLNFSKLTVIGISIIGLVSFLADVIVSNITWTKCEDCALFDGCEKKDKKNGCFSGIDEYEQ